MLLEKIFSASSPEESITDYVHMEQLVNDGSPSGFSAVHQVNPEYRPQNVRTFILPSKQLSLDDVLFYSANPSPELMANILSTRNKILFCLHPDLNNELNFINKDQGIQVSPTASSRTVLSKNVKNPFFIKLHYRGLLGRVDRKMSKKRVSGAAKISMELDKLIESHVLHESFAFFPESAGVVTSINGDEIGLAYREFVPRPVIRERRFFFPVFSLFSKDQSNPNHPSLLEQLADQNADPLQYFLDEIIFPLIRSFSTLVNDGGLWPENHAQNIVLETDQYGRKTRIVHRDLYEYYPDVQQRMILGLSNEGFNKTLDLAKDPEFYFKQKSYLYDFKFGEYVLSPLVKTFCSAFKLDESSVIQRIKDIFADCFPERKLIFSPYNKYYFFPKIVNTYMNNKPVFSECDNPKFR